MLVRRSQALTPGHWWRIEQCRGQGWAIAVVSWALSSQLIVGCFRHFSVRLSHWNCLAQPLAIYRDFRVYPVNLTKLIEGYTADWTASQLRAPEQRIADRIDVLMNGVMADFG